MNGVFYISYGIQSLKSAIQSLKSLKKHNPNFNVAICTDLPAKANLFDIVIPYSEKDLKEIESYFLKMNNVRTIKSKFINLSPYDKTLYLDNDTLILGNLDEIFQFLNENDLILTKSAVWEWKDNKKLYAIELTSTDKYAINSGVFAFKKTPKTTELFDVWRRFCKIELLESNDQRVLSDVIRRFDKIKYFEVMDNKIYNCTATMVDYMDKFNIDTSNIKILHTINPIKINRFTNK